MEKHGWEERKAKFNLSDNPPCENILKRTSAFLSPKGSFFTLTSADSRVWERAGVHTAIIGAALVWNLYHVGIRSLTGLRTWFPLTLLWRRWGWSLVGLFRFGLGLITRCFPDQVLVISSTEVYWFPDLQVYFPEGGRLLLGSLWSYHSVLTFTRFPLRLIPLAQYLPTQCSINTCWMNDE